MHTRGTSVRREQAGLVEAMRAEGLSWVNIATAIRERYRVNPRVALRLAHGWTQQQAADAWNQRWLDDPKSLKAFSRWEVWPAPSGHAPPFEVLNRLAELYQCTVADLVADQSDYRHLDAAHATPPQSGPPSGSHPAPAGADAKVDVLGLPALVAVTVLRQDASGSLAQRTDHLVPSAAVDPPSRVGVGDVERISATTQAFREWDNRWGGGLSRGAVLAQFQWVHLAATTASCPSESVRRSLLTALSDLACVAAFFCYDTNDHVRAQQLWMVALEAAREGGDVDLIGSTLRQLAHQRLHLGRPEEALRLVRLAYTVTIDQRHHPSRLALAETGAFEAWSYAALGDVPACRRAVGRAQDTFADASDDGPAPPWLAHLDEAELSALCGHSLHVLASHVPALAANARPYLREAIDLRTEQFARSRTLNLVALSATYFQLADDIEEGTSIGHQAIDSLAALTSARSLERVRALRALAAARNAAPDLVAHIDNAMADDHR